MRLLALLLALLAVLLTAPAQARLCWPEGALRQPVEAGTAPAYGGLFFHDATAETVTYYLAGAGQGLDRPWGVELLTMMFDGDHCSGFGCTQQAYGFVTTCVQPPREHSLEVLADAGSVAAAFVLTALCGEGTALHAC